MVNYTFHFFIQIMSKKSIKLKYNTDYTYLEYFLLNIIIPNAIKYV